jgi:serine protease Do
MKGPAGAGRHRISRGCLALGFVALCWAAPAAALELDQIHQRASGSVVAIKVYDRLGSEIGEGTGFVVSEGLIATNCHVAREGVSLGAVVSPEQEIEAVAVAACDERHDLALLRHGAAGLQPLPLAGTPARVGQRVVVLGNPLGLAGTLSEGIVAALREDGLEAGAADHRSPRLQITAPISPGSSGSPVMNTDGEVVAVVDSQYGFGQNLNFAVPVERLAALLAATAPGAVARELAPRGTSQVGYSRNVLLSVAFFAVVAYLLMRK